MSRLTIDIFIISPAHQQNLIHIRPHFISTTVYVSEAHSVRFLSPSAAIELSAFQQWKESIINLISFIIVENLITPEMWLKNCRERSPTPASESAAASHRAGSVPRTPTPNAAERAAVKMIVTQSQPLPSATITSANTMANLSSESSSSTTKKPLINVLPSSKLLSRNLLHQKSLRKRARISARMTQQQQQQSVGKQQQQQQQSSYSLDKNSSLNFSADLRAQIQSPPRIPSVGNFNHRPPPLKFLPRPPINLFKFRPGPPNFPFQSAPGQRMPPPPPTDAHPNMTMNSHSLLPPPVVLVPHPIIIPIIIPVPLPLSAFWNAYQVSKNPSSCKITSTSPPSSSSLSSSTSSSEIDNEQQRTMAGLNNTRRVDELSTMERAERPNNEEPLDYTTTKSPSVSDEANSPSSRHDDNEDVPIVNGIEIKSTICDERMETSSNGNNSDKITEFKITTRQTLKRCQDNEPTTTTAATTSALLKDYVNESSRPLRKRRIIAEVDNLSESP